MTEHHSESTYKTLTGLPVNSEAALAYIAGWLSGVVLLALVKRNQTIRFHAFQSVVIFGSLHLLFILIQILSVVPLLGFVLRSFTPYLYLGTFILWLFLIVATYQGRNIELPTIGQFVKRQLRR